MEEGGEDLSSESKERSHWEPVRRGGNMVGQQTSYLERELVHRVDFIEVVHYEVQ